MSSKDSVSILSDVLDKLREASAKIIKRDIKLWKSVEKGDCDIINDHSETHEIKDIKDAMLAITTENSETAELVAEEIEVFSHSLVKGTLAKATECTFLSSVWWGDYYGDKKGIKGLIALVNELKTSLTNVHDENLEKLVLEKLCTATQNGTEEV